MTKFGVSQPVRRKEDDRFLKGAGRYVDDIAPEGAAFVAFFRSTVAHGVITSLDVEDAREAPGVLAVYTAADLAGKLENSIDFSALQNRDGSPAAAPRRPIMAEDRVRFAGEVVAAVVAETRAEAMDALELIMLDTDDLPVHVETAVGGEAIHAEAPDNLCFDWAFGDEAATKAAFDGAAHTAKLEMVDNRVICNSMEPRGCFAEWDGARLHVSVNGQGVWGARDALAAKLGLAKADVRVTNPDVGGGFGMKSFDYPEQFIVALAAKELGRPTRWMSGRGEAMLADNGGRDLVTVAEAAFDADYRLQALRINSV
ncbi:MAG: molybdopterin cofactor-binding domain-containing protein, partial [Pseudomonadota bacterium]